MAHHYIVIIGCGRLGSLLANELSRHGHDVIIVDRSPDAFERLSVEFSGYTIVGDASEQAVLKEADIQRAEFLFAVTSEDNINLMVAQIAKRIFNVAHVIARIDDPSREAVYREFGIDTISPTQLTADAFLQALKRSRPAEE